MSRGTASTRGRTGTTATAAAGGPQLALVPHVVCLHEPRPCHVGLSAMGTRTADMKLAEIPNDSPSYVQTLAMLQWLVPSEIILSSSAALHAAGLPAAGPSADFSLAAALGEAFPSVPIRTCPKKMFDAEIGAGHLHQMSIASDLPSIAIQGPQYPAALAAASALCTLTSTSASLAPNGATLFCAKASIRVRFLSQMGRMILDSPTVSQLEILRNARSGSSSDGTLIHRLDACRTEMGKRMLVQELVRPLCSLAEIQQRVGAVQALLVTTPAIPSASSAFASSAVSPSLAAAVAAAPPSFSLVSIIRALLQQIPDIEALVLHRLATLNVHQTESAKLADCISPLLVLRMSLAQIQGLRELLLSTFCQAASASAVENLVLRRIVACLQRPTLDRLQELLDQLLDPDAAQAAASASAGGTGRNRQIGKGTTRTLQRIFCIRPGVDPVLDSCRSGSYTTLTERVMDLLDKYRVDFDLHQQLEVRYHPQKRAYVFELPLPPTSASGQPLRAGTDSSRREAVGRSSPCPGVSALPSDVFPQQVSNGKKVLAVCNTLATLNTQLQETVAEIESISNAILRDTILHIRTHFIGSIHDLVESVAELDLLQCIASYAISSGADNGRRSSRGRHGAGQLQIPPTPSAATMWPECVFAEYSEFTGSPPEPSNPPAPSPESDTSNIAVAVMMGRHPLLPARPVAPIPNSTFLQDNSAHLIIGANSSGKSTYAKQVALLVLMAHAGFPLPCRQYAHIRITDRIFVRAGSEDDLSTNASTLVLEMRETAHILRTATRKSLVVVDELGRGTSHVDGVSLSWALIEHVLDKIKCPMIFVSHHLQLGLLQKMYPAGQVQTWRMHQRSISTNLGTSAEGSHMAQFHYGIEAAEQGGFPAEIVQEALHIAERLKVSGSAGTEQLTRRVVAESALRWLSCLRLPAETAEATARRDENIRQRLKDILRGANASSSRMS